MGRDFDALCRVANHEAVLPCGGEKLTHGIQNLALHILRVRRGGFHYLPNMNRAHVLKLHRGNVRQDVDVVGIAVPAERVFPQSRLVG